MLSPPVAEIFVKEGWSKSDIEQYAVEHATQTVADVKRSGRWQYFGTPDGLAPTIEPGDDEQVIHVLKRDAYRHELWQQAELAWNPEILIVVAGGDAGRLAALVPSYNVGTRPASSEVEHV